MGGAVSAGVDNDDLINNLMEAEYIKTPLIERVFRAVDRGHYFTDECKESAYKDFAWKCGNLHISAPCIYSEVMESLQLKPNLSFLNLGSGTGYLSTMVGLIIGAYGVNHGVEYHEDVLNYANQRLKEFCQTSPAVDEFEFCAPKFVIGNCLSLGPEIRQYDRVYCGAACLENSEQYMKNIIKVGGILVVPVNDRLLQITRTSATEWETKSVLPVSFATLINAKQNETVSLKLPDFDPMSLQEMCRFTVRSILRNIINAEHPELKDRPPPTPRIKLKKRTLRQLVIPLFGRSTDNEEYVEHVYDPEPRERDLGRAGFIMDMNDDNYSTALMEISELFDSHVRSMQHPSTSTEARDATTEGSNVREESSDGYLTDENSMDCDEETKDETAESNIVKPERPKREKIDSGIGEDIENGKCFSSDDSSSEYEDDMDVEDHSRNKNSYLKSHSSSDILNERSDVSTSENKEESKEVKDNSEEIQESESLKTPVKSHSTYMKEKITQLPLPSTLKLYLNIDRPL